MSLFRSIIEPDETFQIIIEGQSHAVPQHLSAAAALLLCGYDHCRTTPISAAPRAPYCMMGVCHECLVEINGRPNQQGCLVQLREGMVIKRQDSKASVDKLGATE